MFLDVQYDISYIFSNIHLQPIHSPHWHLFGHSEAFSSKSTIDDCTAKPWLMTRLSFTEEGHYTSILFKELYRFKCKSEQEGDILSDEKGAGNLPSLFDTWVSLKYEKTFLIVTKILFRFYIFLPLRR